MSNPYTAKPATAFWRKAVAGVPPFALDPMVDAPFGISATDKVATAGSCFAQNIARSLQARGLQYYVPEGAPADMSPELARGMNYGTFSARYGNVYTVRQLVQLFDRAYGRFTPALTAWQGRDGRFVDPFRPLIQPDGFASREALLEDRDRHFERVRTMFSDLSVFVFTLGLTESWRHDPDGAVVPLAPGVAGGSEDSGAFSFVNFTTSEIASDLRAFHARLREVNPAAKLILTVSPVPLIATYEDRHVLVSTTYSKSALHAAAVETAATLPDVSYFPSYEIVTSPLNRDRYFEDDLRSVSAMGVNHVMRVFFRHYVGTVERQEDFVSSFRRDTRTVSSIVCDEEAIDL